MNYYEAARVRGTSFADLMRQKLVSGEGVFSSLRSSFSDRRLAKQIGKKEKFDILNIARFLTGGSRLAPLLVGSLLGRSKEDIDYFSGIKKRKTYSRQSSSMIERILGDKSMSSEGNSVTVLEEILTVLQKTQEDRDLEFETIKAFEKIQSNIEKDRHRDVMNVFIRAIRQKRRDYMKSGKVRITPKKMGLDKLFTGGLLALAGGGAAFAAIKPPKDEKPEILPPSPPTPQIIPEKPTDDFARPVGVSPPTPLNQPAVSERDVQTGVRNYSDFGRPLQRPTVTPVDLTPQQTATNMRFAERVAQISIFGETGVRGRTQAEKKVGQIAENDPSPGVFSYGIFGMNSGSGSIQRFVAGNPQFGFTQKPGTREFNEEWKRISETRSKEMYDAQLLWYQGAVLEPLKQQLSEILPDSLAKDSRVVAYLADRRVQYGNVMEKSAIAYSLSAQTPEEFLKRLTDFDLQNIGKAFTTYLKNNPNNVRGLKSRIQNRLSSAMKFDRGDMLADTSAQAENLRASLESRSGIPIIINRTQMVSDESLNMPPPPTKPDTNPILERRG